MKSLIELLFVSVKDVFSTTADDWNSVDYEPPRVERLWRQIEGTDARLYLHKIHPCETALFHPHPWPSAIYIVSGQYEMGVGYGPGEIAPPVATRLILTSGSYYVMDNVDGWHYVRPKKVSGPVISMMVTGKPWGRWSPRAPGKLDPLSHEAKEKLLLETKHALSAAQKPIIGD